MHSENLKLSFSTF